MRATEELLGELLGELVGVALEAVDVDLTLVEAPALLLLVVAEPQLSAACRDRAKETLEAVAGGGCRVVGRVERKSKRVTPPPDPLLV